MPMEYLESIIDLVFLLLAELLIKDMKLMKMKMGSSVHLYSDAGFLLAKKKNLSADAKSNKKTNINHYTGNHW